MRIIKRGLNSELCMLVTTKDTTIVHDLMELPFCNMDPMESKEAVSTGGSTDLIQQLKDCFSQFSKTME